jgi:hypothetical protein
VNNEANEAPSEHLFCEIEEAGQPVGCLVGGPEGLKSSATSSLDGRRQALIKGLMKSTKQTMYGLLP